MTTKDYTYLLNKPYSLSERHTAELESILTEFPYLQSARAIYLKGLYNKDSFRYNTELKKTAAHTADRSVLFDFITSEDFRSIDKLAIEAEEKAISHIEVVSNNIEQPVPAPALPVADKLEQSIKDLIKEAEPQDKSQEKSETTIPPDFKQQPEIEANQETEQPEQPEIVPESPVTQNIGKPLVFNQAETHSFAEWLQLSRLKPIEREDAPKQEEPEVKLAKKISLIDKFIQTSPKIVAVKNDPSPWQNLGRSAGENPGLMTETLARVYLEQKKYTKAIQAYEILILKYPEKSVFFANRISEIKDLQQNNN
ncbi:MAG: tetratricopeptide repeat protein [Bacteroidota bacterium]